MRLLKSLLIPFSGLALLVLQGLANAALVDICTFGEGCGPDFTSTHSSNVVSYDATTDKFTFTSTQIGNAKFVVGSNQIDQVAEEGKQLNVLGPTAGGGELLEVIFYVKSDGTLDLTKNSSVNLNGRIVYTTIPFTGLLDITSGGTPLDGVLIQSGVVNEISAASGAQTLLFAGSAGATGILVQNGMGGASGEITLQGGDVFDWSQSWTSSGAHINLVAPIPAGIWLFLSGLVALVSTSKRKLG